jgi:hypothetical protein
MIFPVPPRQRLRIALPFGGEKFHNEMNLFGPRPAAAKICQ